MYYIRYYILHNVIWWEIIDTMAKHFALVFLSECSCQRKPHTWIQRLQHFRKSSSRDDIQSKDPHQLSTTDSPQALLSIYNIYSNVEGKEARKCKATAMGNINCWSTTLQGYTSDNMERPWTVRTYIPCLGGMHFLMSFIGTVGVNTAASGLTEVIESAFSGVPKCCLVRSFHKICGP